MSSQASYELNTIKGHGLAVGDRVTFHGMGSDPLPTAEGTRVEISKVGAKYMLTTVTGDVHTWEFGPSAKVWMDTTVNHHVTTEARTLDNGDTVYVGQCEHGWMSGFHTTEADASDVATGHGEVSRPLYVAPVAEVAPLAVGDTVVTSDGRVGMVEARYSDGTVNVFGIVKCASLGVFYPVALTRITEDMTTSARDTIRTNGRVFVAEAANFGVPAQTWAVMEAHGWVTRVEDGGMSRWVRTRYTADRKRITDGLAVWDYDLKPGRVVLATIDGDGWFNVERHDGSGRSLMNGERVCVAHPADGVTAEDFMSYYPAPLDIPAEVTEEVWTGAGVVVTAHGKTLWTETRDGETRVKGSNGRYTTWDTNQYAELFDLGVISRPAVVLPARTRALLGRRKRKAAKVNARRVKGGF